MIVKINLDDTYELISSTPDLMEVTFYSYDRNNHPVLLKVLLEPVIDAPYLSNVYNLCFGPIKMDGSIDDEAKICHKDLNKLFSTIILFSLTFLLEKPHISIGLDDSSDARAYLYHRMFQVNKAYLESYFVSFGVDWFVRLLRNGDIERKSDGTPFFKPKPESFDYNKPTRDLYRFYLFQLRI